jgi:hypothetical protein
MRPAEAAALRVSQCHLPETGWGMLTLRTGVVRAGRSWTDDGTAHETRHLKARAKNDSRPVPIPPHFVRLLRQHFATHGTAPDGRLFRTNHDDLLQETGYGEVWAKARKDVLSESGTASPLAPAAPTTSGTPGCRSGSVPGWMRWSVPGAPVTASRCCTRCTPRFSTRHGSTRTAGIDAALREWNEPE